MKNAANAPQRGEEREVIVLGTASIETKGKAGTGETGGPGGPLIPGIAED